MTVPDLPRLADAAAALTLERSYETLSGDSVRGFNACVELCDRHVGNHRTALRWLSADGDEAMLTFEELQRRAARFAALLVAGGAKPGDRVAGLLPRRPELLTVLLGAARAGCVYQPLFTAFGPKAIEDRIALSEPVMIVTDRANRPKIQNKRSAHILVIDEPSGEESFADALDGASEDFEPVMMSAAAPFLMMFTSGTTGSPKGVLVPIHMLRGTWSYLRYAADLRDDDSFWNLADPGWAYGLYYALCGPLFLGIPTTLVEASFTVERCYDVIRRFKINNLAGAPTAYRAMAASGIPAPSPLRVISSAGEPLDRETASWLAAHFDCPARDHWGQTELGMVIGDHHGVDHPDSAGRLGYPMPGWSATVLRADGTPCDAGEAGILAIDRHSPLFWFGGYHGSSAQPFVGDHYLTGDTAMRDSDGAFRFVGRNDDVITSSGYRIGPTEVESALLEHPLVAEAAVVGKPDAARTEVVKGFVTLLPGTEPSDGLAKEISHFVKTRLAAHAYPREIEFVSALPKTPSGKIQRFMLRNQEIAKADAARNDGAKAGDVGRPFQDADP